MKTNSGPIHFTKNELRAVHEGDYKPMEKRLRRELPGRASLLKIVSKRRTKAEIRRLTREEGH